MAARRRRTGPPLAAWIALTAALTAVLTGRTLAAYSEATSNGGNGFSAAPDWVAPSLTRTVARRSDGGGSVGQIRQGAGFYVYAQASDTGNPASGVDTMTADLGSVATGVVAAPLTTVGGPWTVGGQTYDHRSAVITANTPLVTGATYAYAIAMTDGAGNQRTVGDNPVVIETYAGVVATTPSLVGFWRLGEGTAAYDTFSDSTGTLLHNHTGEIGASWTRLGSSTANGVITPAGRVRRDGELAIYRASGVPAVADYSVSADIYVASTLASDLVGVYVRLDPGSQTANGYRARLWQSGGVTLWRLERMTDGHPVVLIDSTDASVTPGSTHNLRLSVEGSALSVYVDNALTLSGSDATYVSGSPGIHLGIVGANPASPNSDFTGWHLDNLRVTPLRAVDSAGTNHGIYTGTTLGMTGALAGDSDTAAAFNGSTDHVTVARGIQDSFSIEFWFRSTQGLNTDGQWWGNAGLVDAEVNGTANDFGVSLRSDGRVVAGVGNADTSIVSSVGGLNDGAWHHVVFTRTRATGGLVLYVDGVQRGTAFGNTWSLNAPATIAFARILTGTFSFAGTLDEVAVYSSALGAATVTDHFHAGRGY